MNGSGGPRTLRERIAAFPAWVRWGFAYAALLVGSGLAAPLLGFGFGDVLFVVGAGCIVLSAGHIRLGGPARRVAQRDMGGEPVAVEKVPKPEREAEIARGVRLFLLGLALWAPVVVLYSL